MTTQTFTAATAINHPDLFKMNVKFQNDGETIICRVVDATTKTIVVREKSASQKTPDTQFSISATSNKIIARGDWMTQPVFELEVEPEPVTREQKAENAKQIFNAIGGHLFLQIANVYHPNFIIDDESELGGLQMILPRNKTIADVVTITLDQSGCANVVFTCSEKQKTVAAFSDVYLDGIIHIIRAVTGIATK